MLDDRNYMRRESSGLRLPMHLILIVVFSACCIIQNFSPSVKGLFALGPAALKQGHVWQLAIYGFLHADILHLLFNMIGIWMFGRFIEDRFGPWRLLALFFTSVIAGGLFHASAHVFFPMHFSPYVIGSSAGDFGLLAAFAMFMP